MRKLLAISLLLLAGVSCLRADQPPGFEPIGYSRRGDIIAYVGKAMCEANQDGSIIPFKIRLYRLCEDKSAFTLLRTINHIEEYAPNMILITDKAEYVVTFDSAGEIGRGKHVVVVYGADGEMLKSWSLEQILDPADLKKAPQSVSSTWWRSGARVIGSSILVNGPMKIVLNEEVGFYQYLLDLEKLEWRKVR